MKKVNISQVDAIFVDGSYTIEFLLYYKDALNADKIRSAMEELSSDFWPLFGKYDEGQILFQDYSEKDHFDQEIIDHDFTGDASDKDVYEKYGRMIPSDCQSLFFLKILQCPEGTVLIPRMRHMAGDGYSYFYFLSLLAALSKGSGMTSGKKLLYSLYRPHHDRTVLKSFHFRGMKIESFQKKEFAALETKKILKTKVKMQIKDIAQKRDQRVSTNDVLCAMVLKELVPIQQSSFGDSCRLVIPIDVRKHINEYGLKFIGNALLFNRTHFKTDDVKNLEIDEIAVKIRQSMPAVTKDLYWDYLAKLEDLVSRGQQDALRAFNPDRECLVTNLSKLPVNRLDFGAGPPDSIFPLTLEKNAAGIMADKDSFITRFAY